MFLDIEMRALVACCGCAQISTNYKRQQKGHIYSQKHSIHISQLILLLNISISCYFATFFVLTVFHGTLEDKINDF